MRLEMKTKCYMLLSWMLMQAMWISVQNISRYALTIQKVCILGMFYAKKACMLGCVCIMYVYTRVRVRRRLCKVP